MAGGELVVVQVANTAEVRVDCLKVATDAPSGVAVKPAAFTPASLGVGASALFRFKLAGGPAHMPASLVITATGRQGAIPVSAMGAVSLAANEAQVQVTLSGDECNHRYVACHGCRHPAEPCRCSCLRYLDRLSGT